MASQITPLPTRSSLAVATVEPRQTLSNSQLRHRGLFLVKSSNPHFVGRRVDTQSQAHSIVAQVERERARREAISIHEVHEAAFPGEPVYFERETPLVIARRIFNSLIGLARIA